MSRRGLTVAGLAVAGGAGYYLYSTGGDPKAAQKKLEGKLITCLIVRDVAEVWDLGDASEASRKLKNEAPGRRRRSKEAG